jgi:hypothetical protein
MPLLDGVLFVDNSMMELLITCTRQLEYNKLRARIAAHEKPSLNFGGAMHEALEYRYVVSKDVKPFTHEIQCTILNECFENKPNPVDDWRNFNWACELIERYNHRYMIEPFNTLQYETPIPCPKCQEDSVKDCLWCGNTRLRHAMIELSFALPLFTHPIKDMSIIALQDQPFVEANGGVIIMYTGRIDLPVMWEGGLYIIDHKTTSMLGSQFFERNSMSAQQRGYVWAFQKLTGMKANGYCINALRTKEPPLYISDPVKAVPKGQSPEKWWSESFARERYFTNEDTLTEWWENTVELIHEFFWHYHRGVMPMKTAWCTQYGRCQYYDVCSLPRRDRELMLSSGNYTANTWSPLKEPSQSKQ